SMGVFFAEMAALYTALGDAPQAPAGPALLPELEIQYADFAHWQHRWLSGPVLEAQLDYWRRQLEGAPEVLDLPTDRPRPPMQSFRGERCPIELPPSLVGALRELADAAGATLFMAVLAAFQALLARHSGQDDVLVGSPIANRNREEIEGLIGFFVNTLVLRADLSGASGSGPPTFRELLDRVREVCLGAYAHQDLPF
ncbi:MAG: non-ribosomal peptide synthetase, partial [bacterium]|nr:non-ribosomal peptide synthetase [bacterium]